MTVERVTPTGTEQDKAEIRDVLCRLARAIDRMDWDGVIALADPDTIFDYGPYKGDVTGLIEWMAERHKNVLTSNHFLGNMIAEFSGDAALVETYVHSVQKVPAADDSSAQVDVQAYARYIDEFRVTEKGWRLKSRCVAVDNQLISRSAPKSPVAFNEGRRDRTDKLWSERARLGIGLVS